MKKIKLITLVSLTFAVACKQSKEEDLTLKISPPTAEVKETVLEKHGDIRVDPYY